MESAEFERARMLQLRQVYDKALLSRDPVEHAFYNQNLLHSIAEFLIHPLQERELAERSKFSNVDDEKLKKAITKVKKKRTRKQNAPKA